MNMNPKSILVLEGGAMRGLFTAGVIDIMMEKRIPFDAIIGVSAGAAFGCNYKSHQIGRVARYNRKFAKEWRYCSARSLLLTGDLYGAEFCYHRLPEELDVMDAKTYTEDPARFIVVCTDVNTGKPVYHDVPDLSYDSLEWMRASASMPLASRVVHVGGYDLLDGGISDSIPVQYALDQGYDRIVVVLTQPRDYVKQPAGHERLLRFALRKYPKICEDLLVRHQKYNQTKALIDRLEQENRIFPIYPEQALAIGKTEHDVRTINRVYREGRGAAEHVMPALLEYMGM